MKLKVCHENEETMFSVIWLNIYPNHKLIGFIKNKLTLTVTENINSITLS